MWLFAILVTPAVLLALFSRRGERCKLRFYRERLGDRLQDTFLPPVTLIVPVKGHDAGLRDNLISLASLDYPDYELIVAARSPADVPPGVIPAGARLAFSQGEPAGAAEKLQNLLAAVKASRAESAVLAFADSDGQVGPGWLRALVSPLTDKRVGMATGYRLYLPDRPDFWSSLRATWNSVIFGTFGPGPAEFAWGGAMAVCKGTFSRLAIKLLWANTASDDYTLSRAVKGAKLHIRFAPAALVVSRDQTSCADMLRWIQRQLIITRIYALRLWTLSFAATLMYCTAMVACVAALAYGHWSAAVPLVFLLAAGMLKGTARAKLAAMALPERKSWFERHGWIYTWMVPLSTWLWLVGHIASALTSAIEWRGYHYRLSSTGVSRLASPSQDATQFAVSHAERRS